MNNTTKLIRKGVLAAIIAIQFGSVSHLAYTFSTVEGEESSFVGWIIAIGTEIALTFTALAHNELQRRLETVRSADKLKSLKKLSLYVKGYIYFFGFINMYGNYYYGITKTGVTRKISEWVPQVHMDHFTVLVFAASLTLISQSLVKVYEIMTWKDDKEEKEAARSSTPKQPKAKKQKQEKPEPPKQPEPPTKQEARVLEKMEAEPGK